MQISQRIKRTAKTAGLLGLLGVSTLLSGCMTGPTYTYIDEQGREHSVYQGFDYTDGKYVQPQTFSAGGPELHVLGMVAGARADTMARQGNMKGALGAARLARTSESLGNVVDSANIQNAARNSAIVANRQNDYAVVSQDFIIIGSGWYDRNNNNRINNGEITGASDNFLNNQVLYFFVEAKNNNRFPIPSTIKLEKGNLEDGKFIAEQVMFEKQETIAPNSTIWFALSSKGSLSTGNYLCSLYKNGQTAGVQFFTVK